MPGTGGAGKVPSQWDLLRAAEKLAPRFTLGDMMLQLPHFAGTSEDLRAAVVDAAHQVGTHTSQFCALCSVHSHGACVRCALPYPSKLCAVTRTFIFPP